MYTRIFRLKMYKYFAFLYKKYALNHFLHKPYLSLSTNALP